MENINLPLCISLAALVFIVHFLFRSNRRSLLKTGIHAVAEVISIERTVFGGGSSADAGPVMKVVLNIENQGQPNIQTTIMTTFGMGEILPDAGEKIQILFDPKKPQKLLFLRKRNDGATYYS